MINATIEKSQAELRRLAASGLDHIEIRRYILDVLRKVVGFDIGVMSTVDPATVIWTSCVISGMETDSQKEALIFQNEYREDDIHKISWLAKRQDPVGVLSLVDESTRLSSQRYLWMRQWGLVDELRSALMMGRDCWGSLVLYRFGNSTKFNRQEVELVAAISPLSACIIRETLLRHAATCAGNFSDSPGVVIVNANGRIEAVSGAGERWLDDLRSDREHATIDSLILQLRANNDGVASINAPGRSGRWIRLYASWLQPDDTAKAAVVIEPVRPVELAEILSRAYGLTERERQVAMWVARGSSSKEISSKLDISPMTVNNHMKAIFEKVNVQSRQQMIAALFFNHYLPMREKSATPGPYGWFLEKD